MAEIDNNHSRISAALAQVQERIAAAAVRAGRKPSEVTLLAVSKTFPATAVMAAIAAGQRDFGENRVEEAGPKMREVAAWIQASGAPAPEVRWHLIGHLQSRKVKEAAGQFDLIHSVDTLKLAQAIERRLAAPDAPTRPQAILLECNISGEESKGGFPLAGWQDQPKLLADFVGQVEQIARLPHIHIRGLMTMAPIVDQGEQARPWFASLRALRDALRVRVPAVAWDTLSMGMSDDFEAAIAEGSTLVRLGRAIFGERTP
jgi:PLP dependent protein